MKNKKILSLVLCVSIVFSIAFFGNVPKAKAWPVSLSIGNMLPESWSAITSTVTQIWNVAEKSMDQIGKIGLVIAKIAALMTVQAITNAIIGDGGGGGTISNWNKYLYVAPKQTAMTQMNSFFNTVSRGRLSSLNYDGFGPNYDAYLVGQAKAAINGQPFTTNLQDYATNPTEVFSGGNMKGIMTYMQCANNVACYTMTSTARYDVELEKATTIAKKEQSNGILPIKKNGVIVQPAILAQSALTAVDQLGTQMILGASYTDGAAAAFTQVATGAGVSLAARTLNYSTASTQGQAEIAASNNKFPFSLSYSSKAGVNIK